ncbi:hypothetical protein BD311DRAFT_272633 [Dichomitus squalens]|uniref:Uncharacterized protein n=1 Tax=Dichomitus squalens TaxID=114155 RepID=A0A4Q9MQI3_9APHY|nr:hypothetical protein BD311DRAFT_272633 [Dichomitus squalens]
MFMTMVSCPACGFRRDNLSNPSESANMILVPVVPPTTANCTQMVFACLFALLIIVMM